MGPDQTRPDLGHGDDASAAYARAGELTQLEPGQRFLQRRFPVLGLSVSTLAVRL